MIRGETFADCALLLVDAKNNPYVHMGAKSKVWYAESVTLQRDDQGARHLHLKAVNLEHCAASVYSYSRPVMP
jgi:hypothetical protein